MTMIMTMIVTRVKMKNNAIQFNLLVDHHSPSQSALRWQMISLLKIIECVGTHYQERLYTNQYVHGLINNNNDNNNNNVKWTEIFLLNISLSLSKLYSTGFSRCWKDCEDNDDKQVLLSCFFLVRVFAFSPYNICLQWWLHYNDYPSFWVMIDYQVVVVLLITVVPYHHQCWFYNYVLVVVVIATAAAVVVVIAPLLFVERISSDSNTHAKTTPNKYTHAAITNLVLQNNSIHDTFVNR